MGSASTVHQKSRRGGSGRRAAREDARPVAANAAGDPRNGYLLSGQETWTALVTAWRCWIAEQAGELSSDKSIGSARQMRSRRIPDGDVRTDGAVRRESWLGKGQHLESSVSIGLLTPISVRMGPMTKATVTRFLSAGVVRCDRRRPKKQRNKNQQNPTKTNKNQQKKQKQTDKQTTNNSNHNNPLRGPATVSWWRGLVPVRVSHLTGKPGAGQGSPLRVAPPVQKILRRTLAWGAELPYLSTPHHGECLLAGRLTRSLWVAPSRNCKRWQAVAGRRRRWWWRLGWGCGVGRAASCSSWTRLSTCPLLGLSPLQFVGGRAALGQGC